jgi:hypothetical protein
VPAVRGKPSVQADLHGNKKDQGQLVELPRFQWQNTGDNRANRQIVAFPNGGDTGARSMRVPDKGDWRRSILGNSLRAGKFLQMLQRIPERFIGSGADERAFVAGGKFSLCPGQEPGATCNA